MTDRELIEAFRECERHEICLVCPLNEGNCPSYEISVADLIKRLEALLAENEHLRNVAKKLWCEKRYCTDAVTPSTEGVE